MKTPRLRLRNPVDRLALTAGYLVPFAVAATILGTTWYVVRTIEKQSKSSS